MNTNMNFNLFTPTKLLFGCGKLNELRTQTLPGKKALLLISDGKSVRTTGTLDRVIGQLENAHVEHVLCANIHENPSKEVVMEAAAIARENRCDFIVAVGGGAVLDAAIGVAAMTTNPGDLWDYVHGGTGKGLPLQKKGLPIVTIATTSGTGSEINCSGVISNHATNEKIGFGEPSLNPVLAIVDPELMCTVPAKYTAYQGFDALFHNTEVMISRFVNVLSEAVALSAIENIAKYLPRAVMDGNDTEAREAVAYGSTIAGLTMQLTLTTAEHSMEHAMSAYHHDLPHGAGLIMISNEFYRFFIEKHACDEQFVKMARVMGMPEADKLEDFLTALTKLQRACGVDDLKMSDYGISKEECGTLARNSRETMGILYASNPCEMTDKDCTQIFERSYK
ncbi:iron-containing alcohol dehydrogenase [Bacteroides hominis]|uniref:iron-containing alcohol dehydrogenase n=1 Tax=Bacteroides hominis TaxID=2763023 RepID=UPI0029499CD3|nr:iron-containing alcohol dehydrogenase [Bacteroides hominis (ex Liu et al. 2022)]MDV6184011.1 iron-containing alcohol dehydrogenase [Bacteroides hominis (ex Liu et al. 2022)]